MDRESEDLDLVALGQGNGVWQSVQASGVVAVAEEHDDALHDILLVSLRELAETGGEQAVVQVGGVAQLLSLLHAWRKAAGSPVEGCHNFTSLANAIRKARSVCGRSTCCTKNCVASFSREAVFFTESLTSSRMPSCRGRSSRRENWRIRRTADWLSKMRTSLGERLVTSRPRSSATLNWRRTSGTVRRMV